MSQKLYITTELFASPLNHYFNDYYSLFEIDKFFGSKGSCLNNEILPTGIYEANPPFIEIVMEECAKNLIKSIELAKVNNEDFFCLFLLPWRDCKAYEILSSKPYCIAELKLERLKHYYYE